MFKIGFMGSGKMATALLSGILESKVARNDEVICSDVAPEQRAEIQNQFGIQTALSNREVLANSELVILAFKPQNFPEAVEDLAIRIDVEGRGLFVVEGAAALEVASGPPELDVATDEVANVGAIPDLLDRLLRNSAHWVLLALLRPNHRSFEARRS